MKDEADLLVARPGSMPASLRFASLASGLTHLCDHLLTPPEMHAWSWIFPPIREATQSGRRRLRLGKSLWKNMASEGKDFLDLWVRDLEKSWAWARHLGWVFKDGGRILSFDPNGILLVTQPGGILVSAYIPLPWVPILGNSASGGNQSGDNLRESRQKNPFPREGRRIAKKNLGRKRKKKESSPQEVPPWRPMSPEEEIPLRFRIFRRAAGEVRSKMIRALSPGGKRPKEALALFRSAKSNLETWTWIFLGKGKGKTEIR